MKIYAALTAAVLLLAAPMTVYADEEENSSEEELEAYVGESIQYEYTIDAEGGVTLDHFKDAETYEGALTIPAEIEGHPVNRIGSGCFMSAKSITSVTIPASLSDIGISSFFDCDALEYFEVEEGNTYFTVQDGVLFADEGRLLVAYPASRADETYTVPGGVEEIVSGAFGFAQHLKEVTVTEGVEYIGSWTFAHSDTLEKADIAGSVYEIGDYAFSYCSALHDVQFHSGTENISHAVFAYDAALAQVTLPDTLKTVGQYAFCGTGMECVTIPPLVEEISYCAFGYDAEMNPIHGFVIYGQPGTEAQMYATASDPDNDYENKFDFVAVVDAMIPYELGGGMLYSEMTEAAETEVSAAEEPEAETAVETDADGKPVSFDQKVGAGLFGNDRIKLILGIGGGTAIILAIVLLIAFLRNPKKKPAEKAPAEEAPTEKTPAEEAPAEKAPAEEAPAEETPAEEAPAEEALAEEAPAEEAPAEEASAEKAPAEETPAEEASAEEAPAEEVPAEEVPAAPSGPEKDDKA